MENIEFEQCDYQQDKVINGVLHYWFWNGWVEYTKQELTSKLIEEQDYYCEFVNQTFEKYVIKDDN